MDNNQNQMNGIQSQNVIDANGGQNIGVQGMSQQQMPVNNGMSQSMPQQQMPVNNGMGQGMPQQQMQVNNGMGQGIPQQQMPINNTMMPGMTMNGGSAPKNNNAVLIVIIVIIGIIIVGLGGFIAVSLLGNNGDHTYTEIEDVETEDINDGSVGNVDNSNTQNITYDGYTYKVDAGVVYQEQGEVLMVRNAAGTVVVQLSSAYGDYNGYLSYSDKLKQELVDSGYGTITYETKQYNKRDYMVFSGSYENVPFQFFIVGLDKTHVMQGLMITKTGNEFTDGYNLVEDFVSDAKGVGTGEGSSSFSVEIPKSNNDNFFQQIQ